MGLVPGSNPLGPRCRSAYTGWKMSGPVREEQEEPSEALVPSRWGKVGRGQGRSRGCRERICPGYLSWHSRGKLATPSLCFVSLWLMHSATVKSSTLFSLLMKT